MGNLSYLLYAVTAASGAALTIAGRMDLGTIASFLQYTRTFSHPITQMSQLFNSVLNALAGAERIFRLIDEEPESDEGDVTLVNVDYEEEGETLRNAPDVRVNGHGRCQPTAALNM